MELKNNLTKDQWKSLLKSNTFFEGFNREEIDKIMENSSLLFFPMHEYMIKEKQEDLSFFVIVKGHANVIRKERLPGERKLLSIYEGECFGEMAVITKRPRANSVIAGSNCYVVKFNAATLDNFDDAFQIKLYKQFAKALVERLMTGDSFIK